MKEGDLVLCTVEKISGTTVFVKIENKEEKEGTIITSEIAPGRIRNLRDYVVPGKKIVCKVLEIDNAGNIHLSLRRVRDKEKREVMDKYEKEKTAFNILKSVVKEKASEIKKEVEAKKISIYDFLQSCKEAPEKLKKYLNNEEAEKLCKILKEKKGRKAEVKKQFKLTSDAENGITIIKNILSPYKNITYLAAGKFILGMEGDNYKEANQQIQKILTEIEEKSKEHKCEFEVKEK